MAFPMSYRSQQENLEFKLLSSVFYDVGKGLAEENLFSPDIKDSATNGYFIKGVDDFLKTFPNLHEFVKYSKLKISVGSKRISCHAFLRKNARSGFVNWRKAKSK